MTGRYILQDQVFWGIDITLWFTLITTTDLAFSGKFVNFRFVTQTEPIDS